MNPIDPLYHALAEIDELDKRRKPGPWWQKSWMTQTAPPGAKTEIGQLLCFFDDEGEPRFYDYENDGMFIVKLVNAWPMIRERLGDALGIKPADQSNGGKEK